MENLRYKFRVWDKYTEEMWNVESLHIEDEYVDLFKGNIYEKRSDNPWAKISDIILMQCTGLKDKNGVEIYEGDVLYFEPFETHENDRIVQYINGAYRGKLIRSGYSKLLADCVHEAKVIGNVYQNKALLGVDTLKGLTEEFKQVDDHIIIFKEDDDNENR